MNTGEIVLRYPVRMANVAREGAPVAMRAAACRAEILRDHARRDLRILRIGGRGIAPSREAA